MEIASGLPFDVAVVEARPTRGQSPAEPFRDCLGSAVDCAEDAEQALPENGADTGPVLAEVAEQQETARIGAVREAAAATRPEISRAESVTEERENEPPLVAVSLTPAVPPVETTPSPDLAAAGATEQPPVLQPRPTAALPPELPLKNRGADAPGIAVAAPPPTPAIDPTPSNPIVPLPDLAATAPFQTALAALEGMQQAVPAAERVVPTISAIPAEAEPEGTEARSENSQGTGTQSSQGRFGTERLWGYWLRHGGGGATRAATVSSVHTPQVVSGEQQSGAGATPGVERSPWHALTEAAAGGTGTEPGAGKAAVAGPETRTEPTPARSSPELGSGAAPGLERAARAGSPTPQAPTQSPQPPHQIANAVRVAVLRGGDQVTVQLEPEALGRIHVVLMHSEEGVRASFRVENPLTHQALQADAQQLKQALEARGVNVAHVSVELDQGDRQNRDPLYRHPQGRRRRFGGEAGGEVLLDELALRPEQWRPWGFEARA